jgi:SNF2 family DNA or RNA helicase
LTVPTISSLACCALAICNLIAGGVGLTLTAGTHVIFQDLDWVPANHRQAEDRLTALVRPSA